MAFPEDPLDVGVDFLLSNAWVSAVSTGNGILVEPPIGITRGQADWSARPETGSGAFTLRNEDGRWSIDNPTGPHFGNFRRNTLCRIGVGRDDVHLLPNKPTAAGRTMATTPNHASLDITTGGIDIRTEFQLFEDPIDNANDGGALLRVAKRSSGSTGWGLQFGMGAVTEGKAWARLSWFETGPTLKLASTNQTGGDIPLRMIHDRMALRVTLNMTTGDVAFYWSNSIGGIWTQIGSTISGVATDIVSSTAALEVAASTTDTTTVNLPANVYAFELRDGIGGTVVANPDFTAQTVGATSFNDGAGRTWTIGADAELTAMQWRAHMELSSATNEWDPSGKLVVAPIEVAGLFRRLRQGARRIDSPMRRFVDSQSSSIEAYWPCEDEGSAALTFFSAAIGAQDMTISGTPTPADNDSFPGSRALPTLADDVWTGNVAAYTPGTDNQIYMALLIPGAYTSTSSVVMRATTDGVHDFELEYRDQSTGQMRVLIYSGVTAVHTGAWTTVNNHDKTTMVEWDIFQNGADIGYEVNVIDLATQASLGGPSATNAVTATMGAVTSVIINKDSDLDTMVMGHVAVYSTLENPLLAADALGGHSGELAGRRIIRLCLQAGLLYRVEGDWLNTPAMGPEKQGTLMEVLEECAATDKGHLHEAREGLAVGYRCRNSLHEQAASIALNYSGGEVVGRPQIVRDDQVPANDVTLRNHSGAAVRRQLDDGSAMSISPPPTGIGIYDIQQDVNLAADNELGGLADFVLSVLSVNEYRIAGIRTGLHLPNVVGDAALTANLLGFSFGDRLTMTNSPSEVLGTATVDQIVQGLQEEISVHQHFLSFLTTPETPWAAPYGGAAGLAFVAEQSAFLGSGPVTVTNPDVNGGGTLLFVAVGQGPGNEPAPTITAPDAGATQQFDYDAGGGSFSPRIRVWTFTEDGSANYTFGYGGTTDGRSFGLIIAVGAVASAVVATATPTTGTSTSRSYPTLTTVVGDLCYAFGVQQTTDQMTGGPASWTERHNSTASTPQRIGAHEFVATGTSTTPGNSTWSGTAGDKPQFVIGLRP